MVKNKVMPAISWLLRLILGLSFIWASWHKIAAPDEFARILYGYGLFPGISINILALWVPFIELISGICLITGGYKALSARAGLLVINAMLAAFILMIGFNLFRGHEFDCGCFSYGEPSGTAAAVQLLIRDVFFLAGGVFLWQLLGPDQTET